MKKDKKLSPSQIAKWFINHVDREAGDDITHLKLQKLLYYSQAWHLANYNESLFEEDMQAWTHGPVVPSVWQEYKDYEWQSLPPHNEEIQIEGIEDYLNTVYESYGKFTAKKLEKMTHHLISSGFQNLLG